jgi:EmrB/QacA subfamily drug resistance transporter
MMQPPERSDSSGAALNGVTSRRAWAAVAVLFAGTFMALLDTTIVNVALPAIRESIGASEATLSWIISGYALAFGLALIPAGRLGDRYGHRWVFGLGLALFTGASLWCGLAGNGTELIVARVVQGLGGGLFFPAVTAYIQLLFAPSRRGRPFAVMGAIIGVATAVGPIAGGLIIRAVGEGTGWRWVFAINVPLGALVLIAAAIILPRSVGRRAESVDLVGLALLSAGLVAILVPLIQGQDAGWPLWTYVTIAGGVATLVLFAFWERRVAGRGKDPLVAPHLFSHPQFTGGTVLAMVYFAAFTSIFFAISLLWQVGLGYDALTAGLVVTPFAVGTIIGASLSNRLAARFGRAVLVIGTGMVAISLIVVWLILTLVVTSELTSGDLLVPLLVGGIGSGLFISPNARFIVATVDPSEAGTASGVIGTAQRIGSAIGIAVIGSVLFAVARLDTVGAAVRAGLADGTYPTFAAAEAGVLAERFGSAAADALAVSAGFAVVSFFLVFALPKRVSLQ